MMTKARKNSLYIPRPPGCGCGDALVDDVGRVLQVRTCPVCSKILLDSMRGACYSETTVKDNGVSKRVLLKQEEFFSLQSYASSPVPIGIAVGSTKEDH